MLKDLGVKPYVFPMPVLMIATYNDNGTVDVMNMAWGGLCAENVIALNLDEEHMTSKNIVKRQAFTVSIADIKHLEEADFFGIASANTMPDKFERSGLRAKQSSRVDAPIIEDFPLTLECKVIDIQHHPVTGFRVMGEIVNVLAEEHILDDNGTVDPVKLNGFIFDQFKGGYYAIGKRVGKAWESGNKIMRK